MTKIMVELVKYDMDKTKKRKRANFAVDEKSENAIIDKLERIHKGEIVEAIHEIVWGKEVAGSDIKGETLSGKIKFFNEEKGFGFIEADVKMDDLFFHAKALHGDSIREKTKVKFEVGQGPKGVFALKVRPV